MYVIDTVCRFSRWVAGLCCQVVVLWVVSLSFQVVLPGSHVIDALAGLQGCHVIDALAELPGCDVIDALAELPGDQGVLEKVAGSSTNCSSSSSGTMGPHGHQSISSRRHFCLPAPSWLLQCQS